VKREVTEAAGNRGGGKRGTAGMGSENASAILRDVGEIWNGIATRAGGETSTRGYAASIAHAVGGKAETIFNGLIAKLVSNSRMAPAGIVAVNRARSEDSLVRA
jgi:hypothetical protein